MDKINITTALELPEKTIVKNFGLVRGITVRSRSLVGTIGGSLQTLLGGNISLFTELCEKSRANAIISVRYDATELMQGVTEVLCYGTAVEVK